MTPATVSVPLQTLLKTHELLVEQGSEILRLREAVAAYEARIAEIASAEGERQEVPVYEGGDEGRGEGALEDDFWASLEEEGEEVNA